MESNYSCKCSQLINWNQEVMRWTLSIHYPSLCLLYFHQLVLMYNQQKKTFCFPLLIKYIDCWQWMCFITQESSSYQFLSSFWKVVMWLFFISSVYTTCGHCKHRSDGWYFGFAKDVFGATFYWNCFINYYQTQSSANWFMPVMSFTRSRAATRLMLAI